MTPTRAGIGIVGAGDISGQYLAMLTAAPDVEVRYVASRDAARARSKADEFGVAGSGSYDEMLRDDAIDVVVNLTVPQVHRELTARALEAGKHVWSEKPLALTGADGRELLDLAQARGVRLGCAPDTFLGTGLQSALQIVRSGQIGTPRSAFANFQYGGPNLWHPNPEFLFTHGGGPLLDMGPYYLTALVQVFGSVRRVSATAIQGTATRVVQTGPRAGQSFGVDVPTHVTALYEFVDGGVADVILSFDTPIMRVALEVTGTAGALRLPDPNQFGGDSEVFAPDGTSQVLAPIAPGGSGRGAGVVDLVRAVRAGVPERASGALAYHVLEAMLATQEAARTGQPADVVSRVQAVPLLPAGWGVEGA
ncbi:Gfo/Idh/MocA family protein [Pengzhenrongella phosphoraccumulans]|uniref:Gfo/Idh/MocA family protein n=1 Tax=Pengzhenrongella phosphoraccumulans TaxID=3114394 RepID=UPI00388E5F9B